MRGAVSAGQREGPSRMPLRRGCRPQVRSSSPRWTMSPVNAIWPSRLGGRLSRISMIARGPDGLPGCRSCRVLPVDHQPDRVATSLHRPRCRRQMRIFGRAGGRATNLRSRADDLFRCLNAIRQSDRSEFLRSSPVPRRGAMQTSPYGLHRFCKWRAQGWYAIAVLCTCGSNGHSPAAAMGSAIKLQLR